VLATNIVDRWPNAAPFKFSGSNGRQSYVTFPDAVTLTTDKFFELAKQATDALVGRRKYILLSDNREDFNNYENAVQIDAVRKNKILNMKKKQKQNAGVQGGQLRFLPSIYNSTEP